MREWEFVVVLILFIFTQKISGKSMSSSRRKCAWFSVFLFIIVHRQRQSTLKNGRKPNISTNLYLVIFSLWVFIVAVVVWGGIAAWTLCVYEWMAHFSAYTTDFFPAELLFFGWTDKFLLHTVCCTWFFTLCFTCIQVYIFFHYFFFRYPFFIWNFFFHLISLSLFVGTHVFLLFLLFKKKNLWTFI